MLFTTVIEYQGGSYVRQFRVPDIRLVPAVLRELLTGDFPALPASIHLLDLTPVDGIDGCWCVSCLDSLDELVLIHVIRTLETEANDGQQP